MENQISLRKAMQADLPAILNLYGQPEIDDGKLLSLEEKTGDAFCKRSTRLT